VLNDTTAFEAFVREYQDMVFGTAVRLLGRDADAEDVSQEVFMRAFERFHDIGASQTAAGWLKTVTRNLCLNYLSRYRARWHVFSEVDAARPGLLDERLGFVGHAGAMDLERAERRVRLEFALRSLPDHQRVPLVLFHFEDMSYQAIADALGMSLATVKSNIHRGRQTLKQQLATLHGSR
jgi:RNA polymerase sigma-70 factor (ECF subfamily)